MRWESRAVESFLMCLLEVKLGFPRRAVCALNRGAQVSSEQVEAKCLIETITLKEGEEEEMGKGTE